MLIRITLLCLFCILTLNKAKAQSSMMYNLQFLYNKFAAKTDVNPMFHYSHVNYQNGVCSAKLGPYCKFINPQKELTMKVPLTSEMKKLRNQLSASMDVLLRTIKMDIFTVENPSTIFISSDDLKKYDAYIMKEL